jgi:hypothetical protein
LVSLGYQRAVEERVRVQGDQNYQQNGAHDPPLLFQIGHLAIRGRITFFMRFGLSTERQFSKIEPSFSKRDPKQRIHSLLFYECYGYCDHRQYIDRRIYLAQARLIGTQPRLHHFG